MYLITPELKEEYRLHPESNPLSYFKDTDWHVRWFFSINHKDIGVLYIYLGLFSGLIGTMLSWIIRIQLMSPAVSVIQDNYQVYNVLITAHAFIMIFFMVMPTLIGGFGGSFSFIVDGGALIMPVMLGIVVSYFVLKHNSEYIPVGYHANDLTKPARMGYLFKCIERPDDVFITHFHILKEIVCLKNLTILQFEYWPMPWNRKYETADSQPLWDFRIIIQFDPVLDIYDWESLLYYLRHNLSTDELKYFMRLEEYLGKDRDHNSTHLQQTNNWISAWAYFYK